MKSTPSTVDWCLTLPALRGFVIHARSLLPNTDRGFMEGLFQKVFQRQEVYDVIFDAVEEECSNIDKFLSSPRARCLETPLRVTAVVAAAAASAVEVPNPDQYLEGEE